MKPKWLKILLGKTTAMLTIIMMILLSIFNIFPVNALNNNNSSTIKAGEIVEKRGEFEKYFQNEDGTVTAASYANPIHYKNANGEWVDIDNTLVEKISPKIQSINQEKTYTNKNNSFNVTLNERANADKLVAIELGGYKLSWKISNTSDVNSIINNGVDEEKEFTKTDLNNITSEAIYKNAFDNTDLRYTLSFQSLKEEIILNQVPTFSNVKYTIDTESLSAKINENNDVIFYDANDESKEVFKISAPFAYDAAEKPEYNKNIKVELEKTENGYIITNSLDMEWLKDSSRVYPVTIDPTLTSSQVQTNIEDSHINSNNPNTNYVMSSHLVVGKKQWG